MRENCTPGSVRGAPGNGRSYRYDGKKILKKCACTDVYVIEENRNENGNNIS